MKLNLYQLIFMRPFSNSNYSGSQSSIAYTKGSETLDAMGDGILLENIAAEAATTMATKHESRARQTRTGGDRAVTGQFV